MKRALSYVGGVVLLTAALSCGIFVARADATLCGITDVLSAPGAGNLEFEFNGFFNLGPSFTFFLVDGQITGADIEQGEYVVITAEPNDGWIFAGIECDAGSGIVITQTSTGWITNCVNSDDGIAFCTITYLLTTSPVPTLSEWGMIAAAAGLMLIGVFFAVRRKKMQGA